MMLIIGLTGGIGSGKSTVANMFAEKKICVIDSDIIARQVVQPGSQALRQIIAHFGKKIVNSRGQLQRHILRNIIFTNSQEKSWLENLLHPLIIKQMQSDVKTCRSAYCICVIPLLIETKGINFIDRILVVDADIEKQVARTISRDGSDEKAARTMIEAQIAREKRLQAADDVITNNSNLNDLEKQVEQLHKKYLFLSKSSC